MSIDDKLRNTLRDYGEHYIGKELAIDEIKQAFIDEGWTPEAAVEPRQSVTRVTTTNDYMTGQEFYDRFAVYLTSTGVERDAYYDDDMLEVAKKAAGLDV